MNKWIDAAKGLLFQRQGTLTRELLRQPGGFGLGQVPARLKPDTTTTAVCGFCSTGCGLDVHIKDGRPVNLTPAKDYSVNLGMACPKGWEALAPLRSKARATHPMIRDQSGQLVRVGWEQALEHFVDKMKGVQERHGPESVAFLSTGQIPSEEMALLGMLAKFGMGMVHGDGNTRQCMATAAVAYKQSLGFDAPPFTYEDFTQSDVIVLVGANLCIAHPIMWEHVCRNPHNPKIVVIDPRKTETAMAATHHLPLLPKSDLTLLYGVARLLIDGGNVDADYVREHVVGYEEFAQHVAGYDLDSVARRTGLTPDAISEVARLIADGKRVSFWWTMGVNQSHEGVRVAQAIINLALMTGNMGRPGTGANSITGQCNAMGSRLYSNTTNLMGGHSFENERHRTKVAELIGIDPALVPTQDSWAYDQIIEGIHRGSIRGLWIVATNTAHSWINQPDARKLLDKLEFLVVQDMYHDTETVEHAHLLLPAAGWGEKEGTFINSERRIGLLKKVSVAPGESLADFYIFQLIAEAWGGLDWMRQFREPEDVFRLLTRVSKGQPCDISGITGYDMLEVKRGIQWPLPEGAQVEPRAMRRLFEDGRFYHEDGKARMLFEVPREAPELPNDEYPFTLLTGRGTSAQWHTQTRTRQSSVLRKLYSEDPYVEINPADARRLAITANQWVTVRSRRGRMRARAFVTQIVSPGQVFVPMHYAKTNQLTFPAFDPHSRQPSYKFCAVRVVNEPDPDAS